MLHNYILYWYYVILSNKFIGVNLMSSVEPIRETKTIKNIRSILKNQSIRNEMLFMFGTNVGLLISDILKLKIEDLVKPNFKTVKEYVIITEKKTGKTKKFYIGDIVKKIIKTYIRELPT